MAGQPTGLFDVTAITIAEPAGNPLPTTVVNAGDPIELSASFNGSGVVWNVLKFFAAQYDVNYYIEGLGAGALELDLGTKSGNLTAADSYAGPDTTLPVSIATPGVYQLACTVTFPATGEITGFYEMLIQVR